MSRRVGDIVGDGPVEEEDVLLDDPEQVAITLDVDLAEVDARRVGCVPAVGS